MNEIQRPAGDEQLNLDQRVESRLGIRQREPGKVCRTSQIGVLAEHLGATGVMAVGGALAMTVLGFALIPRETRALAQVPEAPTPPLHSGLTPGTSGDVIA